MQSVENFIQESIFEDTFTPVKSERFQRKSPKINPLPDNLPEFRVIRSTRRKRSISAYRQNGIIEIHIPDRMSRKDEFAMIPEMIAIVLKREAKNRSSNAQLETLAHELITKFLPEFHERPSSITWRTMRERWGSCTTGDGTIRISHRLNGVPEYVISHVLFHELIHLRVPGHGDEFTHYLDRDPDKHRAEAFLEGFEAGLAASPEPTFDLE